MSGHSKWSTIKRAKAATDAKRGKLFTQLAKEIIVAARAGADPEFNAALRMAVQRGRDANMPVTNIERAISRGSGAAGEGIQLAEVMYEGYGPGGTAILLQAVTDNRNRTTADVRSAFTKAGGNLAELGAVAWQFEQKGVVIVEADAGQAEDLALAAIDAGAEDFETYDSTLEVRAEPSSLEPVRKALEEHDAVIKSADLSMQPTNTITLDDKTAAQALRLLDQLEDLDDIQRVFSNADFSDEVLESYGKDQ